MLEKKHFNGGLNSDIEDRLVPNGDYRYALNIRNGDNEGSSVGTIENSLGNTLVSNTNLPSGNNKVIGYLDDKLNNKVYYFVHNSLNAHSIFEYNPSNNTIETIFQSSLLDFRIESTILSPQVIGGNLYFTDGITEPKCINIEWGRNYFENGLLGVDNNSYPAFVQLEDILLIKRPPTYPPLNDYDSDQDIDYNNLRGQLYQFKYKYVYYDGTESAWSSISKLPIPFGDDIGGSINQVSRTKLNNVINVKVDYPRSTIKLIQIAVREVGGDDTEILRDFVLWREIETLSDDSSVTVNDDLGNTLTPGNEFTFRFYNDEVHRPIDDAEQDRLFDNVPYKAKDMCLINGSRLGLFNIEEGNDGVSQPVIRTQPVYNSGADNNTTSLSLNTSDNFDTVFDGNSNNEITSDYIEYTIVRTPSANTVDRFKINLVIWSLLSTDSSQRVMVDKTHFFEYDSSWSNNAIANNIANTLNTLYGFSSGGIGKIWLYYNPGGLPPWSGFTYIDTTVTGSTIRINYKVNNTLPGPFTPISPGGGNRAAFNRLITNFEVNTFYNTGISFKRGARHNLGIIYSDNEGRVGTVQLDSSGDNLTSIIPTSDSSFYVDWHNRTPGLEGDVDLNVFIGHNPPDWATHWQFAYAKNRSVRDFVQFSSHELTTSGVGSGLWRINLKNLLDYGVDLNADINYTFSKGDRIRFIKDKTGVYFTEYFETEIIKEEITGGNHYIFIRALDLTTSSYVIGDFTHTGITPSISNYFTFEIFTPNKDVDKFLYFEVGEKHPVLNAGTSNPKYHGFNRTRDSINDYYLDQNATFDAACRLRDIGDVFLKSRLVNDTDNNVYIEEIVESYRFSDFFNSFAWNQGRPNIEDKEYKRINRDTTVRYSEPFVPETNINGLSSFLDLSYETYDWQYGSIQKVYPEDGQITCFQELKVGKILVSERVLYDSQGNVNAIVGSTENQVLHPKMVYYAGEYGISKNPESFAVYGNHKYFTDANRGVVLRLGGDGLTPISEYDMSNYFENKFNTLINSGLPFKVYGAFDKDFNEYVLAFEELNNGTIISEAETISFNAKKKRWSSFWSYKPDILGQSNINLVSFKDGDLYTHNTNPLHNNFYGVQYDTEITFISNINPKQVKFYKSISTESTDVFTMVYASNQEGQLTNLENKTDWENREGIYYAAFLRDVNSGGIFAFPLLEGDNMRSHSMEIKLKNDSVNSQKLFMVNVRSSTSMLSDF